VLVGERLASGEKLERRGAIGGVRADELELAAEVLEQRLPASVPSQYFLTRTDVT
jgi:hypothetical protein